METVLIVIVVILVWALVMWRNDVAQANRKLQHKRQKCADAYNAQLRANYVKWFDAMTKEGYQPSFLPRSRVRELTPDEIGIEEWNTPNEYWKMDPDWRRHPDCDALLTESYSEDQRNEMKQPDWDERRKLRAAG